MCLKRMAVLVKDPVKPLFSFTKKKIEIKKFYTVCACFSLKKKIICVLFD